MALLLFFESLRYVKLDRLARNGGLQGKHVLMYAVEAKLEALCIKMVEKGADVNAKYVSSICSPCIHGPQVREA